MAIDYFIAVYVYGVLVFNFFYDTRKLELRFFFLVVVSYQQVENNKKKCKSFVNVFGVAQQVK